MKARSLGIVVLTVLLGTQPLAASSSDSSLTPTPRIIGGATATISQAPWQVALLYKYPDPDYPDADRYAQFCGGSILNSRWVLTAAHCVEGEEASDLEVLAGEATLSMESKSPARVGVENILIHPGYVSYFGWQNDIALLELSNEIDLGNSSSAAAIALPAASVKSGTVSRISGWGDMDIRPGFGLYPTNLQVAQVSVFSDTTCRNAYGRSTYTNALMLCAGVPNYTVDTCQGDSGGPLASQVSGVWTLHGVTSFGNGCAQRGYPGVYTEVFAYRSWINSFIWSAPEIDTMTPSTAARSSSVTITGENLSGVSGVRVGSTSATFSVISDTELTFVVPARAVSGVVIVSNPGHNVSAGTLTIPAPPSISRTSPNSISVGTRVTVTGSGFIDGATAVTVPGSSGALSLLDITVVSTTQLTGVIPTGARTGNLVITTEFGSANKRVTIRAPRR